MLIEIMKVFNTGIAVKVTDNNKITFNVVSKNNYNIFKHDGCVNLINRNLDLGTTENSSTYDENSPTSTYYDKYETTEKRDKAYKEFISLIKENQHAIKGAPILTEDPTIGEYFKLYI